MQELLGWAMTEQTAHAIYSEFRRLYPGRYSSYSSGERPTYTKQTPRPWRDLLQFTEQARAQIGVPTEKATHKVPKRSRLDILDDRLLSELTLSERVDLKESALREILATLRPDEKVMVMVEEKFEARLLAERLKTLGMKAGWYAGRSVAKRHGMRENLKAFHSGQIQILCSTSAGDTGHDIPGVSRVIRWVPITSPKKNEQSHGRAGRQPGIPGVYTVLTIADDDPDFDERMRNKIAHSRLASMDRV
jgi:ERCC4-related helicase